MAGATAAAGGAAGSTGTALFADGCGTIGTGAAGTGGRRHRSWRRGRYAALIGFQRAAALVVAARAFRIGLVQALELVGIELHFADGELALQRLGGDAQFKRPGVAQRAGVDDADARQRAAARLVGLRDIGRLRLGEPGAVDDERGKIDGRLDLGRAGFGIRA